MAKVEHKVKGVCEALISLVICCIPKCCLRKSSLNHDLDKLTLMKQ